MRTTINRLLFSITIILVLNPTVFSQTKKYIDFNAIDKWTSAQFPSISPDGNFAACVIDNEPSGWQTILLKGTESGWERQLVSKKSPYMYEKTFSSDSKHCIFKIGADSLAIVKLGTSELDYIPNVSSFKVPEKGDLPYVLYEINDSPKKTVVYNLRTKEKTYVLKCESSMFSPDGQYFLTQSTKLTDSIKSYTVDFYDLKSRKKQTIWEGNEARNFKFDGSGGNLAFIADKKLDSKSQENRICLFYYEKGDPTSHFVCSSKDLPTKEIYNISSLSGFSHDGSLLYFKCSEKKEVLTPSASKAKVDVWNFNDPRLKSDDRKPSDEILSVVHLKDKKIYSLTRPGESYWDFDPNNKDFSDEYLLVYWNESGIPNDDYWNQSSLCSIALVLTKSGERKEIGSNLRLASSYRLSPNGKYILYFDSKTKNYYSYSIKKGTRQNLTKSILAEWNYAYLKVQDKQNFFLRTVAGWVKNSNDVLLQDRFDIWRISLDGTKSPICITNGYGKRTHIEFCMPSNRNEKKVLEDGTRIILSAFNPNNKKNGFFGTNITGNQGDPKQLTIDDHAYFIPLTKACENPVKAENAEAWIVSKQGYNESLNYYYTNDFVTFKTLTNNHPEKAYNWMTAELVNWKLPDGTISRGTLYKPENFDPNKKYPLIFEYYEELSNNLNVFLKPERAVADINIPYYVSNGYLVFNPDIKRTKAGAGQDALNTMVSAAKHLSKLSYVDAKRMGLCGTSMGGYKTNFIVTHTNLFAAANPNSGPTNLSSWGLSVRSGDFGQCQVEVGQFYLEYSIRERPDLYIKYSPVFFIKNVQTPLLMMYNKLDEEMWIDGSAMFQALRHEGKRAWMLQYDGHGHFLDDMDTTATTDWTIRQKQYFDHYLMGKPAPKWMTQGISTELKQINDGFELDTEIKTPEGRLLTPGAKKWKEEADRHKPFNITIK